MSNQLNPTSRNPHLVFPAFETHPTSTAQTYTFQGQFSISSQTVTYGQPFEARTYEACLLGVFQNTMRAIHNVPVSGLPFSSFGPAAPIVPPPIPTVVLPSKPAPLSSEGSGIKRSFVDLMKGPENRAFKRVKQKTHTLNLLPSSNSKNWQVLFDTGIRLFAARKYEESIDAFRQACLIYKDDSFASKLTSACRDLIDDPQTLVDANQGLAQNVKNPYWLFLRGLCNIRPNKYQEALQDFQRIVDVHPDEILVRFFIKNLERMIARNPK